MNPLLRRAVIEFRARQPEQEEGRSVAGKVASVVAPALVVGGVYKMWAGAARKKASQKARSAAMREAEAASKEAARTERVAAKEAVAQTRIAAKTEKTDARNKVKTAEYVGGLRSAPAPKPAKTRYAGGGKFDYGMTYEDTLKQRTPAPKTRYAGGGKFDYGVKPTVRVKALTKAQQASQAVLQRSKSKVAKTVRVGTKGLIARVTPVQFNDRHTQTGEFLESAAPLTVYRKASRVVPWAKRASHAAGDIGDIASGRKPKDPFYKKSWFKNAVLTAAIGAPLLVAKGHRRGRAIARGDVHADDVTGWDRKVNERLGKSKLAGRVSKLVPFSARPNRLIIALRAHARLVEFATVDPLERGWDLRDARGRSARVYAPGSRRRERRPKEWGEKTENIRAVRNAALVTAAGLGGLAIYQGRTIRRLKSPKPAAGAMTADDFRRMHPPKQA
jgi:hypothetical protein